MWDPGENSQEEPWDKVLYPPSKDTHNSIFELLGKYRNSPGERS